MNRLFDYFATGSDAQPLNDKARIDALYRKHRLSIILTITLGYGVAYTCRLGLSIVKKPLIDSGIFSADQLGMIGAALMYGYAFGKFFNGFLADHANIKRFAAFGVLMSALVNLGMGWTNVLFVWIVLWALNGWFQGFNAPGGIVALTHWFSDNERGRYYGIWSGGHAIGEGLTFIGSAALVSLWGWQYGFWAPGIVCIVLALIFHTFLQDRPQTLGLPQVNEWRKESVQSKGDGTSGTWREQLSIFRLPSIWLLGIASAAMYMTRYGLNSWGVLYLQEAKGYSLLEAGSMISVSTFSGIAGGIAFGFISDKLFNARRPPVNMIYAVLEIAALYIIFYGPPQNSLLMTCAFGLYGFGLTGLVTSLGGLFAVDIVPKKAAGAVMGFIGVFSYVAAAVQERISGYLIEQGTTIIDGTRYYDFSRPVLFWIIASLLSMLLALILWNVNTRA
jgi:OPA family sugar phosphate sensor protein UhpC-like MFS transporter